MVGFFGGPQFTPATDIPDLAGKVIIVTGGNIGLGYASAYALAKHNPEHLYIGARSQEKAEAAIAKIKKDMPNVKISHLPVDLTSFESIKKAAEDFQASNKRLDILMNNAGIMGAPASTTKEGYEIQFGTNHVGHALLTKLLLPVLKRTAAEPGADVRVINLSSEALRWAPKGGVVFPELKSEMTSINSLVRYGQSKLCNVLYTKELAKHHPDIKVIAIHPGAVNTNLISGATTNWPMLAPVMKHVVGFLAKTADTGALNQLWATSSKDALTGEYYVPVAKLNKGGPYVQDPKLASELWDWTEKEFADHGIA